MVKELELPRSECHGQLIGFSHVIFLMDFRWKGRNCYQLLEEWIKTKAEEYWKIYPETFDDLDLSRAPVLQYQLYGLLPIGYSIRNNAYMPGWWFQAGEEVHKEWFGGVGDFDSRAAGCFISVNYRES